jgi:hypothetical protein
VHLVAVGLELLPVAGHLEAELEAAAVGIVGEDRRQAQVDVAVDQRGGARVELGRGHLHEQPLGGCFEDALGRPLRAFLGSGTFLVGILAATAACVFPVMLRSVTDPAWSLTAYNSSVPADSLRIALGWWVIGFPLALLYFYTLFRLHRGKAVAAQGSEGY